jgi:hypothetical protein
VIWDHTKRKYLFGNNAVVPICGSQKSKVKSNMQ